MSTVGIIGAGRIGGAVARLAAAAGWDVVVSNGRDAESLRGLVDELGPRARAAAPEEAAAAGEVVVVSVPIRAHRDLPVARLGGRTVIDTMNYDPPLHGSMPDLLDSAGDTTSEVLQRYLNGSRVVKALNTMHHQSIPVLARPHGATDRSAVPVAGDDPGAKAGVVAFLDDIGFDAVDAGGLGEGWRFQPGTPAHGHPYSGQRLDRPVPAGVDAVRAAVAAAERTEVAGVTDEELRIVTSLYRAIGGQVALLDGVLADDWEDIPAIPGQPKGPAGLIPHIHGFRTAFAGGHAVLHTVIGSSGRVAVRGALRGRHVSEFLGVAPTGMPAEITIHEFHEIEDGRIVRSWHLEDLDGWKRRAAEQHVAGA